MKKGFKFAGLILASMTLAACTLMAAGCNKGGNDVWPVEADEPDDFFPASSVEHTVTFDYGDGKVETKKVAHGHKVAEPAAPSAPSGKKFYGWINKANGGQIWNFKRKKLNSVLSDIKLEPCFVDASLKPQWFEAELCPDLMENGGMEGATYSGGNSGLGLVYWDYDNEYSTHGYQKADPGFIHYLYIKGDTLTWELESDKDAENVTLFMRLGAEYGIPNAAGDDVTSTINDQTFPVKVNGVAMKYGEITFHNVSKSDEGVYDNKGVFLPLQDYLVSASVSLKAGKNTIQMIVDNNVSVNGTIASSAPCVDAIKLYSSSTLTWPAADMENIAEHLGE